MKLRSLDIEKTYVGPQEPSQQAKVTNHLPGEIDLRQAEAVYRGYYACCTSAEWIRGQNSVSMTIMELPQDLRGVYFSWQRNDIQGNPGRFLLTR